MDSPFDSMKPPLQIGGATGTPMAYYSASSFRPFDSIQYDSNTRECRGWRWIWTARMRRKVEA